MVAKLIKGQLVQAPDKVTIANPEEALLKRYLGYKDYTEEVQPEYDPETQRLTVQYAETDSSITKRYTVEALPQPVTEEVESDV